MMGIGTRIAVLALAAFAWSTQALAERGFTNEFASGATRPRTIALLPPKATIVRARVVETEGLIDESVVFGSRYNQQLSTLLAAKGYEVKIVGTDTINSDPQLQEYVVDANRGFDEMVGKYRPKKLASRIYNVGDSSRLLAERLGVDAVAFSTLNVTITAAGKAIMSALIGGTSSGASSTLWVVNGDTGDLEATLFGVAIVTPGEKTDPELDAYVAQCAERTLKRMPGSDPTQRVDVASADDEEVLDEVEQLLKK
jgi:hypothetical protein